MFCRAYRLGVKHGWRVAMLSVRVLMPEGEIRVTKLKFVRKGTECTMPLYIGVLRHIRAGVRKCKSEVRP